MAFATGDYKPVVYASNAHNEEQSLRCRTLAKTTVADDESILSCLSWAKSNHSKLFPVMWDVESVSFDSYLVTSNASPGVKKVLRETWNKLQIEGIDENTKLSPQQLRQFTFRKAFVKVENLLLQSPLGHKQKTPRMIMGAQPEFICIVGPWIAALQTLVKRRWKVGKSNIVFSSGMSAKAMAEFVAVDGYRYVEDDVGKWDASVGRKWCEYEVWLCRQFGAPRAVLDLMTANIQTRGCTASGWGFSCDGTRKSGDPYTSLFNSVLNGIMHSYLYCESTSCSFDVMVKELVMLVQGDDNAMAHFSKKKVDWVGGMARFGFESEALYRRNLYELEFCSSRIYSTTGGPCFGPKPGKVLAKFGYIADPPKNVSRESLLRGVALGLQKQVNFIPILARLVERVLVLTTRHKEYFHKGWFVREEHKMKMDVLLDSTGDTDLEIFDQYMWSGTNQEDYERELNTMQLGSEWELSTCISICDRDTSGDQILF